jgi:tryptophanyl-tRNA synthetase
MRILSGIQPSGALHLGNYFGMMKPALELQAEGDAFYFIANYHSMTSLFDAEERRKNTLDVALDFLACGLDPKKTVFFRQSDVPEVTELTWLLTTVTPMGLLERCHSYKDKLARGVSPNHGLFAYPVLMAADILIYDSNVVPVGRDQKQACRSRPGHRHQIQRNLRPNVSSSPNRRSATRWLLFPELTVKK